MMNEPRPEPPLTDIEFSAWVGQAERGDWLEYHRGFLGIDMSAISSLPKAERRQLRALANIARRAFEEGLVHLVQVRLGSHRFAYLAVAQAKRGKAAVRAMNEYTASRLQAVRVRDLSLCAPRIELSP